MKYLYKVLRILKIRFSNELLFKTEGDIKYTSAVTFINPIKNIV